MMKPKKNKNKGNVYSGSGVAIDMPMLLIRQDICMYALVACIFTNSKEAHHSILCALDGIATQIKAKKMATNCTDKVALKYRYHSTSVIKYI